MYFSFEMSYPKDYFDINRKIMKIASLWPLFSSSCSYKFFSFFCFFYCIIFCTPSEFVSLLDTKEDITDFTMNLGIALTHGIASLKVINWYVRRKQILLIMEILNADEYHYETTPYFNPGLIIEDAKRTNKTLTKMFFILANIIPGSSYVLAIISFFFQNQSFYSLDKSGNSTYCRKLPFHSWIPFDRSSYWSCFFALLFQSFPFTYLTVMIVAMDTLYMGLINYLTAHLLVLQEAFRNIRTSAVHEIGRISQLNPLHDDKVLDSAMMRQMKKCTIHFQTVQRYILFLY